MVFVCGEFDGNLKNAVSLYTKRSTVTLFTVILLLKALFKQRRNANFNKEAHTPMLVHETWL